MLWAASTNDTVELTATVARCVITNHKWRTGNEMDLEQKE